VLYYGSGVALTVDRTQTLAALNLVAKIDSSTAGALEHTARLLVGVGGSAGDVAGNINAAVRINRDGTASYTVSGAGLAAGVSLARLESIADGAQLLNMTGMVSGAATGVWDNVPLAVLDMLAVGATTISVNPMGGANSGSVLLPLNPHLLEAAAVVGGGAVGARVGGPASGQHSGVIRGDDGLGAAGGPAAGSVVVQVVGGLASYRAVWADDSDPDGVGLIPLFVSIRGAARQMMSDGRGEVHGTFVDDLFTVDGGAVAVRVAFEAGVRCAVLDRNLHSRVPLVPTPARLKRACV
jgi:hypothetical protein